MFVLNLFSLCFVSTLIETGYSINGYFFHQEDRCLFRNEDLGDLEYIRQFTFNKIMFLQYNSTEMNWTGYTPHGVKNAEKWNHDPAMKAEMKNNKIAFCMHNAAIDQKYVLSRTSKPYVKLKSLKSSHGRHPAKLVCSAYDFYPRHIKVTWLKDGKEVTSDVISTVALADGDWYYQIHSYLEYTPRSGGKISCMVEHASFSKPMVYDWGEKKHNPYPESERTKNAIGAFGLVLGALISIAGLLYFRKRSARQWKLPVN
ncbi:H-2 class II histocompatibility antigen, E-S beta chain-like [Chanos chanos]|uniref:H-2 class II histocompatibility antigen, E-S beta chain-like n=1 Tax=Chanos chanos TaxID=29144 RepID=A0A6J2UQW3_CHACN|nr:H-2 class II histocompatibility antigen, E-S beta chain-like [Chanos chanos]